MAYAAAATAALGILALQGCGAGGDGDKTSTTMTTTGTTGTTTSTTTVPQVPPMNGSEAAKYLNEQYMGLNESDPNSSIGVVIHMGVYEFYCKEIFNTKCFEGKSDCMCSTSVYNHMMSITDDKKSFAPGLQRQTGMVFNTSMVHAKLAKCAYQYDGASDRRYNHGCGQVPAGSHDTCDDQLCPFYNLDPETRKEVTDTSPLVTDKYCPNHTPKNPKRPQEDQCYFKGAGFFPPHEHPDELRKMIDQRLQNQKGAPELVGTWNEIVLDVKSIHEELKVQPALVIPAIIWVKREQDEQWNKASLEQAQESAAKLQKDYKMDQPVPVVAVQDWLDVTKKGFPGPFVFDGAEDAIV